MSKKILAVISTFRGGVGGHYHSCATITSILNDEYDISVLNIGEQMSPIIKERIPNSHFITFRSNTFRKNFRQIEKFVRSRNFDILHSYDIWALYVCSNLGKKYYIPHVHTKCGGSPFGVPLPPVRTLILFSMEDKSQVEKHYPKLAEKVYLVPNRVEKPKCDNFRIEKIRTEIMANNLNFLLVCRIGREYEELFFKSINLICLLRGKGIPAALTIIGNIQDQLLYDKLKLKEDTYIILKTEEFWTSNASSLIVAFDFVIGQGRSFMESAIVGKPTFCLARGMPYPTLPDRENIDAFANYNFSKRTELQQYCIPSFDIIITICKSASERKLYESWIKEYANSKFNIQYARDKYRIIYEEAECCRFGKWFSLSQLWWRGALRVALFDYERIYTPSSVHSKKGGIRFGMLWLMSLGYRAIYKINRMCRSL